jgi:hypothetical protein
VRLGASGLSAAMIASSIGQGRAYDLDPSLSTSVLRPLRMSMHRSSVHQISTRHWPALAALFAALGALGLVACGSSSHSSSPGSGQGSTPIAAVTVGAPPPNVVTSQQINAYHPGSPAHALLEFWQAVQFSDVLSARRLVSSKALASVTPARFTTMIQTLGDNIPGLRIVSSTQIGVDASVRVFLLGYAPNHTVSTSSPQSFQLRGGSLGYRLSDLSYFLRDARAILVAQQKH